MDLKIEENLTLIAERAQLAEGIEGVLSILLAMYRFPSLKNKKVSQKTGIAIPALAAVRGELVKANIIEKKNFLGDTGREWIRKNLGLRFEFDPLPGILDVSTPEIPEHLKGIMKITDILNERPEPDFALDQSHATPATVINRVFYLLKKGSIEGKKMIFLGDDDATSIAVGLLDLAEKITVIDIDPNIIDFLSKTASRLSLKNFNVIPFDLREACPKDVVNEYDIVIMDPPYTNEGLRLFLKRARQVLRTSIKIDGGWHDVIGKKCLLCFGNKPPKEMLQLQLSILDHGFTINEMIPYFNIYKGASILGQFSHLYYLQLTRAVSSIGDDLSLKLNPIYTSEVKIQDTLPFRPLGYHFIGEMHFENQNYLLESKNIQDTFYNALVSAGLTVLDVFHHHYKPHGFSSVAILKTSHAAIHTWPEHGYISIDIFICDEFSKGLEIVKFLKNNFKPQKCEFFYLERGTNSPIRYKTLDLKNQL
ncbi:MAG: adenosylmethionine decarboxylase [Candidatus Lokiarchaeota archaeon]|nr:adenosylmethionine decarboxylase [Candidatus Lokiarchaeota archaeon]